MHVILSVIVVDIMITSLSDPQAKLHHKYPKYHGNDYFINYRVMILSMLQHTCDRT